MKRAKANSARDFNKALSEHCKIIGKSPVVKLEVSTEKELDQAVKAHPHLAMVGKKRIAKAMKKAPSDDRLKKGEQWCMMDSGAGVPGICVSKHCPQYAHLIRAAAKKRTCVLANGNTMALSEEIDLLCALDEHLLALRILDLAISMDSLMEQQPSLDNSLEFQASDIPSKNVLRLRHRHAPCFSDAFLSHVCHFL